MAALQSYDAQHPGVLDSTRITLQRNLDQAHAAVDRARAELAQLETVNLVSNGITGDMAVIDAPTTARGLFGISGMRSDNLKTDAMVFAACLVAAIAYLVLPSASPARSRTSLESR
jgi:hypothetical protein